MPRYASKNAPAARAERTREEADDVYAARRAEWRARREARRAKQRIENVVRAKAMHEARIAAGSAARTSASELRKPTIPTCALTGKETLAAHVGCSGWFYWHWHECFYPQGHPSSRWFEYYASRFDTVEL